MSVNPLLFLLILFSNYQPVAQYQSDPIKLNRINGHITINGHVNEAAWNKIEPLPLISYDPVAGLPPSDRTEIRIGYDDHNIYASIRAFDSDPDGIRSNTLFRDRLSGDDVFHILLDTYNDYESAIGFTITPSGAKRDALISNDGEGPRALNTDYSTYWDVATSITDEGWFAEVRIPFSSIGFQDDDGTVIMGLFVQRGISRKNERVIFPEVPAHIERPFFKPSIAQRVIFEGIYSSRPLHITPYIVTGFEQSSFLNESQNKYDLQHRNTLEPGLDLKLGVTNNLTLDLTLNTDFAQVEADDQQINLTRFNLFFPEKRQFFQERSGIFEFNTGDNGRLFHSRQIGLTENGSPLRILGGSRLTGRIGTWDIGFLNMQTNSYQGTPSENFGVIRLRRELLNPYSYAGFMATSRIGVNGDNNYGLGLDSSIRYRNNHYLYLAGAFTLSDDLNNSNSDILSSSTLRIELKKRTRRGFSYQTSLGYTGDDYHPEMGFVPRYNYYMASQRWRYGWFPPQLSSLLWHGFEAHSDVYVSRETNHIESFETGLSWNATTKPGTQIRGSVTWFYEDVTIPFPLLRSTIIQPGTYQFLRGHMMVQTSSGRLFRTRTILEIGTFYDGTLITASLGPTWNISKHFELEGSYIYNLSNAGINDEYFNMHVAQIRIRTALNTKLSANAFIQLNTVADIINSNIRIRYNFRDGNDFWLVYNEGLNINRIDQIPILPRSETRTLMAKYTHTFHY